MPNTMQMRQFYEPGYGHVESWHWMHSTNPEEYNEEYDRCRHMPNVCPPS